MGIIDCACEMVYVPKGEFLMGIPDDCTYINEKYPSVGDVFEKSHPEQTIFLDAFWIDKYPVTNAEYYKFVAETNYRPPFSHGYGYEECVWWDPVKRKYFEELSDYPVVFVNWYDAMAYCEWVGKRLPTEAEWEKAARGTDGRRFPWGNDDCISYYKESSLLKRDRQIKTTLCSVYEYPHGVSPYGCYHMYGNIGEWCNDWYSINYPSRRPKRNPKGPRIGKEKIIRGDIIEPHIAYREDSSSPWLDFPWVGFRCAKKA